jgi:HlyD family secretion protein
MSERGNAAFPVVVGIVVVGGLAFAGWFFTRPQAEVMQGEVVATEVSVSSKIPGRVSKVVVREGDRVRAGDPIAVLTSPEIDARMEQAMAARSAAEAEKHKADTGARQEQIREAKNMWERARAGAELAARSFGRVDRLHADGVVPAQRRDEAEAALKSAQSLEDAARAGYEMALSGARVEDKTAAAALVRRASGAVAEVQAAADETTLRAPASGEVARRNVEPGEIAPAGFPVVTLVDVEDSWVVFQIREDRLERFKMGSGLRGKVPALGGREVELKVTYVASQAEFATWRSTKSQGGFDLRTFEVRARPPSPVEGLRPGMTVVLSPAR